MTCKVSNIEWYKQGDNGKIMLNTAVSLTLFVQAGCNYSENSYSITIYGVDAEDTGLCSCVAGNILGETVETAYLLISGTMDCRISSS